MPSMPRRADSRPSMANGSSRADVAVGGSTDGTVVQAATTSANAARNADGATRGPRRVSA
jgi:hypothetical protein